MRRSIQLILVLAVVTAPGCLKKQLRAPVEDHRVLTHTISENHAAGKYAGKTDELQEDLEAMAEQAELLDNIVKGEEPAPKSEEPAPEDGEDK